MASRRRSFPRKRCLGQAAMAIWGYTQGPHQKLLGYRRPYSTGLSRRRFIMAEREGHVGRAVLPHARAAIGAALNGENRERLRSALLTAVPVDKLIEFQAARTFAAA